MKRPLHISVAVLPLVALAFIAAHSPALQNRAIPKTWDDSAVRTVQLPLASAAHSPVPITSDFYYRMPVRPVYASYPVYAPGRDPPGYLDSLRRLTPRIVFDAAQLQTDADWIRAGALVFAAPIAYDGDPLEVVRFDLVRDSLWYRRAGVPLTKDGIMPFARYVIRKQGVVEVGSLACAMCHTRVLPNGSAIDGAQGNFPFDRALAFRLRANVAAGGNEAVALEAEKTVNRALFRSPWLQNDPAARTDMRYAALNQDADMLSSYGDFRPLAAIVGQIPDAANLSRYSDEQLYALARYVYSLEPPTNPNRPSELSRKGEEIFQRERCTQCHTPPLYTNNKLTLASGFQPPAEDLLKLDVMQRSVGTDPGLSLMTRRGTGYYKIPSLRGVWYRGPFEHNGSAATPWRIGSIRDGLSPATCVPDSPLPAQCLDPWLVIASVFR